MLYSDCKAWMAVPVIGIAACEAREACLPSCPLGVGTPSSADSEMFRN